LSLFTKDCVLSVRVIVRGKFIGTEAMNAMPTPKAAARNALNGFCAHCVGWRSRCCPSIGCRIGPFEANGCKETSTVGRGSRPTAWIRRPASWRQVASNERGVPCPRESLSW